MWLDPKIMVKALSPKIIAKVLKTFDRATTIVVGVSWGAAILMMIFAIYVMSLSASARRDVDIALTAEPALPKIVHTGADAHKVQTMVDRLHEHYPGIKFMLQPNMALVVTAANGSQFRDWLNALSFIDTITPEYHWTIQEFCVGKCSNNELMRATLVGETTSFQMPQP